jgi:hypothetical protein
MLVHEMEVLRTRSRQASRLIELSATRFWPAFEAEGARVVAAFSTVFGATPELTVLYEYPDAAAWERTRLRAATPGGAFDGQQEREELTVSTASRLLVPSPYWPLRAVPSDGIFTTRTFHVEPGAVERFQRHTAETIWPHGSADEGADFLGLWSNALGTSNEVVMLARYRDFAHWDAMHPQRGQERDEAMVRWWDTLRERDRTTLDTEVRVLRRVPAWPTATT